MIEIDPSGRGDYHTNFFFIRLLNGCFDRDLSKMSQSDLGTFVHEYCHYLQNISTIFGLKLSNLFYQRFFEIKRHIVQSEVIDVPMTNIDYSEGVLIGNDNFEKFYGYKGNWNRSYDEVRLVTTVDYVSGRFKNKKRYASFSLNKKELGSIHLGNHCIKEGMAHLVQEIFDPNLSHDIYPYRVVEIIAGIIRPSLLQDKRKLIALCVLSLNAQDCINTLFDLMQDSKYFSNLNGEELIDKYLKERFITFKGVEKSIKEFQLEVLDEFESNLYPHLTEEPKHFKSLLKNIKISFEKSIAPIISILYIEKENLEKLEDLMDFYGIPLVRDKRFFEYSPVVKVDNKNGPAYEFNNLYYQLNVLKRVLGINKDGDPKDCFNRPFCEASGKFDIDEYCFSEQWRREDLCPFTVVSNHWNLRERIKI